MRYRVDHRAIGYRAATGPAKVIDAFTGRAMATFVDWQDADEYVKLKNNEHELAEYARKRGLTQYFGSSML